MMWIILVMALVLYGIAVITGVVWVIHETIAKERARVPEELKEATLPLMDGIDKTHQRDRLIGML